MSGCLVACQPTDQDLQSIWDWNCHNIWKGICSEDKNLLLDFHGLLPPELFHYFLEGVVKQSEKTYGMPPVVARDVGIFSFGDKFFFMLQHSKKYSQIHVSIRYMIYKMTALHINRTIGRL